MTNEVKTTDRLRHEIDAGRTGGKVAFSDPAASPLGTDDEAAGTPASPEAIAEAARHEVRTTGTDAKAVSGERNRTISGEGRFLANPNVGPTLAVCAVIAVIGAVIAALVA